MATTWTDDATLKLAIAFNKVIQAVTHVAIVDNTRALAEGSPGAPRIEEPALEGNYLVRQLVEERIITSTISDLTLSNFPTQYVKFVIEFIDVKIGVGATSRCRIQFSTDGGATTVSSYAVVDFNGPVSFVTYLFNQRQDVNEGDLPGFSGEFTIYNMHNSTQKKHGNYRMMYPDENDTIDAVDSGFRVEETDALDSLYFTTDDSAINSGTIRVWGYEK